MAASSITWSCRRSLGLLSKRLYQSCCTSTSLSTQTNWKNKPPYAPLTLKSSGLLSSRLQSCGLHTSQRTEGLMEFFDRKEVWGKAHVPVGRPWRLDELRIKSNQDLHKLWYVLLKERNMLLTMEAEYNRNCELFPNPERIEKVEESMENILEVIQERDDAIAMLETGESIDKGGYYLRDFLGRMVYRKRKEYAVPPHLNKAFRLLYPRIFRKEHVKYLALYREKIAKRRYAGYMRRKEYNKKLIKKFPHLEGQLEEPTFKEPDVS